MHFLRLICIKEIEVSRNTLLTSKVFYFIVTSI